MDFNDTPAEAKFRDEARSWLKANVPTAAELEGLDYIGKAKLWQKRKYDAGCFQHAHSGLLRYAQEPFAQPESSLAWNACRVRNADFCRAGNL